MTNPGAKRTKATEEVTVRRSRRDRSDVVLADSAGVRELLCEGPEWCFVLLGATDSAARVVDLRRGNPEGKREALFRAAREARCRKLFTLVPRMEAPAFRALGFREEGVLPAYFQQGKRRTPGADGVLLGVPVRYPAPPLEPRLLLVADGRTFELPSEPSAAQDRADRAAKVALRELAELPAGTVAPVTLHEMEEADGRRSYSLARRAGTALTAFTPLHRRSASRYFVALGRADFAAVARIEEDDVFGGAFLELLESPTTMDGVYLTMAAVDALLARALDDGATHVFAFAPSDDEGLAMAYLHAGFQRSGLLLDHLEVGGVAKDATVWVWRP